MGILKNLLVLGSAKFANVIKGTVEHAQNGIYFGTCDTAAATAAKVITLDNPTGFELKSGVMICVKFTNTNTASNATFNVEGTGAKSVSYAKNTAYTGTTSAIMGNSAYSIYYVYDGTYWCFLNNQNNYDNNSDTIPAAYCATAAGTAAKVASMTYFALRVNEYVHVNFRYTNTAAAALTLNINGTGAKPIYINGSASSSSNYILPAGSYIAFYDGTNYQLRTDNKLPANITGTVNGHSVNKDVPSNAVFTDTTALGSMTGTLAIDHGGTGGTTALAARTNLGFGDAGAPGNPVYFDDGLPVAGTFTWGVDDDQNVQVGWDGDAPEIVIPTSTALPIASGGTGATTAAEARTNLGLGSAATYSVVSSLASDDTNLVTGGAIKTYIDATGVPSAICTTLASTMDKVAVCSSYTALANSYIQVIMANSNTASDILTLNINGTGTKPIFINGTVSSSSNKTLPAGSYLVFYDGTNYYFRTDGKITGDITGKVNGYTVNKDVPSDAVFTDTTNLSSMSGTLEINHGGTGATTALGARTNLKLVSEIVAATDWAAVNGSFTVQGGTKIYASAVGIQLYVQIKTTAAISNGTTLFTVNTNFRPPVNYIVLPIRSSATPYAEVGTVWIGSSGSAIVYGALTNSTNYYITGFYLL